MSSLVLAYVFLMVAGHFEAHYHTNLGGSGDQVIRKGGGLFMLAGALSAIPSLAVALASFERVRSITSWLVGVLCVALGVCLEIFISLAPQPWFVF